MLVQEMNVPMVEEDAKRDRIKLIIDYFKMNRKSQDFYAIKFFLCELINFINVIGQIYFTDMFLGFEFTTYGTDVLSLIQYTDLDQELRDDPMNRVFPKVTKCTFHKFGPSGTVEKFDGLCVLSLNIINEKIYVALWFWFLLLAVISGVMLIYRMLCMFAPGMRVLLLQKNAGLAPKHEIQTLCDRHGMGDWFLMMLLSNNIDPLIFKEFVHEYYEKLGKKDDADSNSLLIT